jgi:hypothetical protein
VIDGSTGAAGARTVAAAHAVTRKHLLPLGSLALCHHG